MTKSPASMGPTPLTPQQQGLWFIHQAHPDCGAYHLVFSLSVEGADLAWGDDRWLNHLLHELMREHPLLAVRMREVAGEPMQEVDAAARPVLRWTDAQGLNDAEVRERARQDARQPIDPTHAPLWRVHLYRTRADRWVVAVVMHHMLLDFWSLGLLLEQVAGRLGLRPSAPAPDGLGALLRTPVAQEPDNPASWAHWQASLTDAPLLHGLPTERPRPAQLSHEGASESFVLKRTVSDQVRQLAQSQRSTPFMVLLAAYAVWIHRLSGDTDMVIASPWAGRISKAQARMLGQFVNTLPLRVRVQPEDNFLSVLTQVRSTVLEAMRYQDTPFPRLVERLSPRRDPGVDPLAQLGFSWERLPLMADFAAFFMAHDSIQGGHPTPPDATRNTGAHTLNGLRISPFHIPQQEGQLDLLMEMGGERDGCLVGTLKYRTALFDHSTVAQWLEAWKVSVEHLVSAPEASVVEYPLVPRPSPALPNGRPGDLPAESVLTLIEAASLRVPHAPAVRCGEEQFTHAQLLERARSIAQSLRATGVAPGDHVGLLLERRAQLPAALLGIWMAGAAYVPMDPGHPKQRLLDTAADAGLAALISQSSLRELWPRGVAAVDLDAPLPAAGTSRASPPSGDASAYLIYTSGSTGRPKGVQITHRSVLNFLVSMQDRLRAGPDTRLLAVTTPAFDISVLELLLPLLAGGCVVVAETAVLADGVALSRLIEDERISMMQATPATWKLLIDAAWPGRAQLVALCGGEALVPWLAEALYTRCAALWNLYGPTETTVWSTAARLEPGEAVHLGSPLDNTSLHVLDERQRPVPQGTFGELWIGGAGLAKGYWRRPELTAERFTELPQLGTAGRLYRTGDRVRVNGQGRLEHHGRLDHQVKLRGFRIELGEIESCLMLHPAVRDAVVVLHGDDTPPGPQLVAHVVPHQEAAPPSAPELKRFLAQHLPSHMLPAAFVFLDALPQTPNGKIDRRRLPPPETANPATPTRAAHAPPRDTLEIQLADLFERLLGVSPLNIHDDFFELGGHSLLAARAVADIRRQLHIELPVAELMRHGSVAALAERLRGGAAATPSLLVPLGAPISPAGPGTAQPLWLFHPIGGTVFCYLALSRRLAPGRPVVAVQSPGLDRAGEAEVTVPAMARRYLAELRAVQPHGPYLLGGWCFGGVIAFEAARQLADLGEAVDGVVLIDTRAPVAANIPSDGDDAMLMSWFARDLAVPYGKRLDIPPACLRGLDSAAMFQSVLDAARQIGVLPDDATTEQLTHLFEAYLANGIALQTHLPQPQTTRLLLLRAKDEPAAHGPLLGWESLAQGPLTVVDASGDHNSVMQAPHAAELAQLIELHAPCVRLPATANAQPSNAPKEERQP